ncbi:MAG: hypothetical protein Q7K16_02900 [Candidatus Azambacteria bacterium]|nr:hypothetical protein [Candidatus Azambacteria bacterium]
MNQNINLKSKLGNLVGWRRENEKNLLIGLTLVMGLLIGLGIGLLFKSNQVSPIIIDKNIKVGLPTTINYGAGDTNTPKKTVSFGNFVASINGEAYYPINCAAAQRIKEENRIWFNSSEEAEVDGYRPAQNCPVNK